MSRYIYLLLLFFTSFLAVKAQEKESGIKTSIEEVQKKQLDFFTQELTLTKEQSEKLSPILRQYMVDRYQLYHQSPRKRDTSKFSEADYKEAVENVLSTKAKGTELENKYYQNLLKILPAEKVFKYQFAEKKYYREVLQKHKHK